MKNTLKTLSLALAGAGLLTVYGCGGGGGSGSSSSSLTMTGTAATGAAISGGTVAVKCASGTGSATTNADGTYSVTVTGGTAPCLIKVTSVDASGVSTDLYSGIEAGQTVANVTPLTQMVIASALGSDPAAAFSAGVTTATATNLSKTSMDSAVTNVKAVLTGLGLDMTGIDPLKTALVAATDEVSGNLQDQQIDGLMAALKGANIDLSAVTTALVNNPTSATASVTAIKAAADSTTPLSTSALASCPVARTGGYWYASPGDMGLHKVVINFDATNAFVDGSSRSIPAMHGYDYAKSIDFAVTQVKDSNDTSTSTYTPCAYQFALSSAPAIPVNVRVSASGPAGFSNPGSSGLTAFPNATPITLDSAVNSEAGLLLPAQQKWTNANLAGTMYGVHFSKVKSGFMGFGSVSQSQTITRNFFSKFEIAADGLTAKAWTCTTLGDCPAATSTPTNTFTISAPVNGVFTMTSVLDPVATKFIVYRGSNGDTVVLGVNAAASSSLTNNFVVMTNRVSASKLPVVGGTGASWSWTFKNAYPSSVAMVNQDSDFVIKTFVTVDAATKSFTRSWTDGTTYTDLFVGGTTTTLTDTITLDSPLAGMWKRTNSNVGKKDIVFLTGQGWGLTVPASPDEVSGDSGATVRGKNFMSIYIKKPV